MALGRHPPLMYLETQIMRTRPSIVWTGCMLGPIPCNNAMCSLQIHCALSSLCPVYLFAGHMPSLVSKTLAIHFHRLIQYMARVKRSRSYRRGIVEQTCSFRRCSYECCQRSQFIWSTVHAGVTGQSMPATRLFPILYRQKSRVMPPRKYYTPIQKVSLLSVHVPYS